MVTSTPGTAVRKAASTRSGQFVALAHGHRTGNEQVKVGELAGARPGRVRRAWKSVPAGECVRIA